MSTLREAFSFITSFSRAGARGSGLGALASDDSSSSIQSAFVIDRSDEKSGAGPTKRIKVMILLNDRRGFEPAIAFLNRREYEVIVLHSIAQAVKILISFRPRVALISWNLRRTDIRRVYKFLTTTFHIVCIAFAEDNTASSAASLLSSGISNTLLPPVSGPGIHMRIQSLLRPKGNARNSRTDKPALENDQASNLRRISGETELTEANIKSVPSDTQWQRWNEEKPGSPTWKGTSKKHGSVFYFKGPEAPAFDGKKQEWQLKNKTGAVLITERTASTEFSAIQSGAKAEDFQVTQEGPPAEDMMATAEGEEPQIDWEARYNAAKNELGDLESAFVQPADGSEALSSSPGEDSNAGPAASILEISVKEALQFLELKVQNASNSSISPAASLKGLIIESAGFNGYLILAAPQTTLGDKLLSELNEKTAQEMKNHGRPLQSNPLILELGNAPADFQKWAKQSSDFHILASKGDQAVALAFVSVERFPRLKEDWHPEVIGLDLQKDIVPGRTLLFDLFLFLPKNDKFILYLSKGTSVSPANYQKLLKYGVKWVFARTSDKENVLTYLAKNTLLNSAGFE